MPLTRQKARVVHVRGLGRPLEVLCPVRSTCLCWPPSRPFVDDGQSHRTTPCSSANPLKVLSLVLHLTQTGTPSVPASPKLVALVTETVLKTRQGRPVQANTEPVPSSAWGRLLVDRTLLRCA